MSAQQPISHKYAAASQLDPHPEALEAEEALSRSACLPTRAIIALMVFLGAVFLYMVRANFSLNLLAMVQKTSANGTALEQPDYGERIAWTVYEQSALLGAFFYGYAAGAVPIGFVVERYGCAKRYILLALGVCALLEAASPAAARQSFAAMFAVRLAMGVLQSAYFPSTHKLYAKWAPRSELGLFCCANLGSSAGTLFTWLCIGWLIEAAGWTNSFYVPAGILGAFTVGWYFLVFETPDDHPRIADAERVFIAERLPHASARNTWPPLRAIVASRPCWALMLLQFGSDWGLYFVLTGVPKFLNEVLGFQLASTGMLAGLPYLARWLMSIACGVAADACVQRGWMGLTALRRVACVFSHILPGLFVLAMGYASHQPYLCVTFMTLSLGFNGAVAQSTLCNFHDLTPNYASSLNALINGFSSCAGFVTPLLVAHFTAENNVIEQWRYVFGIGAFAYIAPAVVFMCMGSAAVQPWNDPDWEKSVATTGESPNGGRRQQLEVENVKLS